MGSGLKSGLCDFRAGQVGWNPNFTTLFYGEELVRRASLSFIAAEIQTVQKVLL